MQNLSYRCDCARCGEQGKLVTHATYHNHRRRPPPTPLPPPTKQARAGPSPAERLQRLQEMIDEIDTHQSRPPPDGAQLGADAQTMEQDDDWESSTMRFEEAEEDLQDDDEDSQEQDGEEAGQEQDDRDWYRDEDFELVEAALAQDVVMEQDISLAREQKHRDSWVWKVYMLVMFMMAFTGLTQECATLFLSFVFNVLAPLIEQGHDEEAAAVQVKRRDRLVTPAAVARSLGMADSFARYLVCVRASCSRLRSWDGKVPPGGKLFCQYCGELTIEDKVPKLEYSHRSIASTLARLLQDERIESALEEWKVDLHQRQAAQDERYGPIWTGAAWRQDCTEFDCSVPCQRGHKPFVDDGDLNLKITLNIDWFGPHKGRHTGHHSVGVVLIRVDNVPERFNTLDRRCLGIHLLGLMPGPHHPPQQLFMRYLQLVVEELIDLDKNGITIPTAKHPEGRKLRVRLSMVVADSQARGKILDFSGIYWRDPLCPYCPKQIDMLGTREAWEEGPPDARPPPPSTTTAARCEKTVLRQLKHFDLVLNGPPDPMHAVFSGMCDRFWWDFLVNGCSELNRDLKAAQKVISIARIPSGYKRPDKTFGDRGAGKATAKETVTFYRCLLPFIMLVLWQRLLIGVRTQILPFHPTQKSKRRQVVEGWKHVRGVYPIAMLLCCIVELLEEDLDEAGVEALRGDIIKFNVMLKDLLGNGWLTYNTHIAEHIPDAIKRFGAGRGFSCLPFERYNGKLGNIKSSGKKLGKMETTMMRAVGRQHELRQMLAESSDPFLKERLLAHVQSRSEQAEGTTLTRMDKANMELDTLRLLLEHLNGPTRRITGRFKVAGDPTTTLEDVPVFSKAQYLRAVVMESYPSEIRITSAKSTRGSSTDNSYVLIRTAEGGTEAVRILWLFEKDVVLQGRGTAATKETYMHVRKLKMVSTEEAMMTTETPEREKVLCEDLLARMKISFASRDEDGEQLVIPLSQFVSQLAVVPLELHMRTPIKLYGLKAL